MFDVIPFYVAWTASSGLMIERNYGRTAACFLVMAIGYLEYKARMEYGSNDLEGLF